MCRRRAWHHPSEREQISSMVLVNAKLRDKSLLSVLSCNCRIPTNHTATELEINIFKSDENARARSSLSLSFSRARARASVYHFRLSALPSLFLFSLRFRRNLRFRSFLNGFLDYRETNDYCSPRGKYRIL